MQKGKVNRPSVGMWNIPSILNWRELLWHKVHIKANAASEACLAHSFPTIWSHSAKYHEYDLEYKDIEGPSVDGVAKVCPGGHHCYPSHMVDVHVCHSSLTGYH